jgi:hypothetical protein
MTWSSLVSTWIPAHSQIILGVSLFDIFGAIGWMLSTAPIPTEYSDGSPTYIYGAVGNDATCTAQGFLLQLSFTAVFYNISLSSYYFLGKWAAGVLYSVKCVDYILHLTQVRSPVIVYGWRENKLKLNQWWLHGVPLLIGIVLAFGGILFYQNNIVVCHIQCPPYFEETWYPGMSFSSPLFPYSLPSCSPR